jgi:hypothetical protein
MHWIAGFTGFPVISLLGLLTLDDFGFEFTIFNITNIPIVVAPPYASKIFSTRARFAVGFNLYNPIFHLSFFLRSQ